MKEMLPAFQDSIFDSTLADSAIDIAEMALDTILVNGVLQEIPIVKTIIGVGKFVYTVRDRNFLKQTFAFFKHLHDGSISSSEFSKYRRELEADSVKAERELSRVMILLDKTIDTDKAEDLASFYKAYIKNDIFWDDFCELSEALNRMFISDRILLFDLSEGRKNLTYDNGGYSVDRLISIGLIQNPSIGMSMKYNVSPISQSRLKLTTLGTMYIKFTSI